ncbi:MAG TPA: AMP-dependent synthetase [Spirochaetes bacterium]|nr:AMP-dependent synthetase [Spirochaetota bacterium]
MATIYSEKPWLKFYDKNVSPSLQYPKKTFAEQFLDALASAPDRTALYFMGAGITFRDMDVLSNKFAHYLKKQGLKPGDTVGVCLPNIPAFFIAILGIQKAGCVLNGISPLLTPKELEYQLNDAEVKFLLTMDILYANVESIVAKTGVKTIAVTEIADFLPSIKRVLGKLLKKIPTAVVKPVPGIGMTTFMDIIKQMPADAVLEKRSLDDPMLIQYTGGTTGSPKGAVLTQFNLVAEMTQVGTWMGLKDYKDIKPGEEIMLSAFPLFHIAGLAISLLNLSRAYSQVLIPNPRDQDFIISAIKKYKPIIVVNVPTVYMELLKKETFRALDFSRLKMCFSGGAPFPPEYIKDFEKVVGEGKLVEGLGMTETSPLTVINPTFGKKKPGSIGVPISDTEVKLVDPETGSEVGVNEPGELLIKGPQVFTKGYFNKPEETAKTLKDGWVYTGDVCTMDEDGYLFVVDRLKDMVNVSGLKVFTRQVDDVLVEHPDIDMAATIGLPDPNRPGSEMVVSAVLLKPGVEKSEKTRENITHFLREKMAPYKVPKRIDFMDSLPLSAVGKILKKDLRKMMAK